MGIPAPYIIDKIREERERRQPAQVPLHIEIPIYDPVQERYRGRQPPEPEQGVVEINFELQKRDQNDLYNMYRV